MIGILLVSHGEFANGLKDAAKLIIGDCENVECEGFVEGQDIENLMQRVQSRIETLDKGSGVLVFVDLFGASPYNAALFANNNLKNKTNIKVITGMNLAMLIEAISMADSTDLNTLAKSLLETGKDSIVEATELLLLNDDSDEDGDY